MGRTRRKRLIGLTVTALGSVTLLNAFFLAAGVQPPTILPAVVHELGFAQGYLFQTVFHAALLAFFLPATLFIGFPWAWKFVLSPIIRALIRHSARARSASSDPY